MNQPSTHRLWRLASYLGLALLGTGCDLTTKAWAEESLSTLPGQSMSVFEPLVEFSLAYNRGTAFSMVGDLGSARLVFGVLALALAAGLLVWAVFSRGNVVESSILGLIAAGAIGNGYDRVFRFLPDGGTGGVDFIKINYPWGGSWPTFNIADILVFVGAALFVAYALWRRPADPDQPSGGGLGEEKAAPS